MTHKIVGLVAILFAGAFLAACQPSPQGYPQPENTPPPSASGVTTNIVIRLSQRPPRQWTGECQWTDDQSNTGTDRLDQNTPVYEKDAQKVKCIFTNEGAYGLGVAVGVPDASNPVTCKVSYAPSSSNRTHSDVGPPCERFVQPGKSVLVTVERPQ